MNERHAIAIERLRSEVDALERDIRVINLHADGLGAIEISERMGIARWSVSRILLRYAFKINAREANYLRADPRRRKAALR